MNNLKKVLFITYYWPPATGASIERILKFYKYLHEYGWEPIILTVNNGDFPLIDENTVKEIRENTIVYKTKNFSLHKIFNLLSLKKPDSKFKPFEFTNHNAKGLSTKISKWVKFNSIPDTRIFWMFFALKKAKKICKEHKIELIFSSSPPQTNHLIATKLSKATGIPCVGDLRDPWTDVYWLKTFPIRNKLIHKLDKKIEISTLNSFNTITTVSPAWVKLFQAKTSTPVKLIYNGFDSELVNFQKQKNKKFTIRYLGSLSYEQDLTSFIKSLELLNKNIDLISSFSIEFYGNFPDFVKTNILQYEVGKIVKFFPYVSSSEAYNLMQTADLLLLFIHLTPDNGAINYKLYEYLSTGNSILAYGNSNGDAANILLQSELGKIFSYSEIESVTNYIEQLYNYYLKDETVLLANNNFIRTFSRRALCSDLAQIFNETIAKKT